MRLLLFLDAVRDIATKLLKDIDESDKKILYLKSVLRRLRVSY